MGRGTKVAVSPYERRRWLEDLEKGKGITQIAKAAGRDIRVVKRHIEIAQQEREVARARRDFLLSRVEQHQEDLLSEVRRLREVLLQSPPQRLEPGDPLEQKVHQALKEHTGRLPLRGLLESYCDAAREYEDMRSDIGRQLEEKEADLKSHLSAQVATPHWAAVLLLLLEKGDPRASRRSYAEYKTEDGCYWPCWGEFNLTSSPVTAADLASIMQAHRELQSTLEAYLPKLRGRRERLRELADLIVEELDVFLLKRLVSGRCRYCPL